MTKAERIEEPSNLGDRPRSPELGVAMNQDSGSFNLRHCDVETRRILGIPAQICEVVGVARVHVDAPNLVVDS